MPKKHGKKNHPHGLPHLSDAASDADILAGAATWAEQVKDGAFTFALAEEHAIDEDTDLLVVVRKRVHK